MAVCFAAAGTVPESGAAAGGAFITSAPMLDKLWERRKQRRVIFTPTTRDKPCALRDARDESRYSNELSTLLLYVPSHCPISGPGMRRTRRRTRTTSEGPDGRQSLSNVQKNARSTRDVEDETRTSNPPGATAHLYPFELNRSDRPRCVQPCSSHCATGACGALEDVRMAG